MKSKVDMTAVFEVVYHSNYLLVIQTHAAGFEDENVIEDTQQLTGNDNFGSFNLGLHVEDNPAQVLQHRCMLLAYINKYLKNSHLERCRYDSGHVQDTIEHPHIQNTESKNTESKTSNVQKTSAKSYSTTTVDSIYWLTQIHSNRVVNVTNGANKVSETFEAPFANAMTDDGSYDDQCAPIVTKPTLRPQAADALVTHLPNTALAIMTADCVPIALYNQNTQQVAAIHAGWQGLANGVIATTCQPLNTQQDTVKAWIGACISQPCYEVSQAVVDKLLQGCQDNHMDVAMVRQKVVASHHNPDKAWLDLPALAVLQLQAQGVVVMNKAWACSYSDSRYYSYRRMTHQKQTHTGRMALLVMRLE